MVRQGWLEPVRLPAGPGYALTDRARHRLDDAAARIYRTRDAAWDGGLGPAGAGARSPSVGPGAGPQRAVASSATPPLSDSTWISPVASAEVDRLLGAEGAAFARFRGRTTSRPGPSGPGRPGTSTACPRRTAPGGGSRERLLDDPASELAGRRRQPRPDERAFAVRSVLVHEWRKFLFTDPGLPAELLPADWAGARGGYVLRRGGRPAAAGRVPLRRRLPGRTVGPRTTRTRPPPTDDQTGAR